MSEEVKNKSFEHIEIITTPNTKLFEVRLIVSMDTYGDDDETGSALEWLHNLLHLASEGEDIKAGATAGFAVTTLAKLLESKRNRHANFGLPEQIMI
jgi:hypothetical protein